VGQADYSISSGDWQSGDGALNNPFSDKFIKAYEDMGKRYAEEPEEPIVDEQEDYEIKPQN
jgi:hypothetical protein